MGRAIAAPAGAGPARRLLCALLRPCARACALALSAAVMLTACAPARPPATATREPIPATVAAAPVETAAPATLPAPTTTSPPPAGPTAEPSAEDVSVYLAALRPDAAAAARLEGLTRYRLDITVAPDLSRLEGEARIRYTNREQVPLDIVHLHLYPNLWEGGMSIEDARVDGKPASLAYPSGDDVVGLRLDPTLAPGASVELAMRFAVPIPAGDGVGNYGEFAYQEGVLAMAHVYPAVAVYDDGWRIETPAPQGDVIFHDASLYDVRLTAPEGFTVAATGATLEHRANGDGQAVWRIAGGPMRDFNMVASAAYRSASAAAGEVTITSYFLPEDEEGGARALTWAGDALRVFEDAFGPYPYRELDIAASGTSAAGIEYPGLIVMARRLYSDPERQAVFRSATAHEVSHQWWYNVVGNDQLRDPWLDEALAQYSTYLYFSRTGGEAGRQGFLSALEQRWARVDQAEKPIGLPVAAYEGAEYSAIVYGRGGLFFLALRDRLGEEKMREFLQRYYAEQAWDIAQPAEFRALAEQVAGEKLDDLFRAWVDAGGG